MTGAGKLKNYYYQLYQTLLETHIKTASLKPTVEEEVCVKSFCVLAHAAIEEFIEDVSKSILQKAYLKYKSKTFLSVLPTATPDLVRINSGISQLIETLILASNFSTFSKTSDTLKDHKTNLELVTTIYKNGRTPTINELAQLTKGSGSYTIQILKETNKFFASHIESNNGASLKYLLRILIPVGVDIPNIVELNSLQKLAEYRGSYAHGAGVSNIISAPDLVKYATDVIKLCKLIEKGIDDFDNL
ncbi:HEPN domain-containing protein [Chitinophaga caseinilytica]|uniref:HEPN domain-containing protein n=1 Tax=Chitinophaga caseinilytica TaxID=2267521 RepID=UPI003C2EA8DA